jgi:AraC-like DNA-binding protein
VARGGVVWPGDGLLLVAHLGVGELLSHPVELINSRVRELWQCVPHTSPTIRICTHSLPLEQSFLTRVRGLNCRGVLVGPISGDESDLREALTSSYSVADAVRDWLASHTTLQPRDLFACGQAVASGLSAEPNSMTPRHLLRTGVGSVGSWFRLGVALRTAVLLQRRPKWSVIKAALHLGFHDDASLSRSLFRAFGKRPAYVRSHLGLSWLLYRWCGSRLQAGALRTTRPPKTKEALMTLLVAPRRHRRRV